MGFRLRFSQQNQSSETIQLPRATPRGPMFPTPQVDPVLASAAISACDFLADRWQQGFAQPHGRKHGPWLYMVIP